MDATHHEKIVDKLMQYRGKIPKHGQLATEYGKEKATEMREIIDLMLDLIDSFANMDQKGLIR
jgi:hypothetical protein